MTAAVRAWGQPEDTQPSMCSKSSWKMSHVVLLLMKTPFSSQPLCPCCSVHLASRFPLASGLKSPSTRAHPVSLATVQPHSQGEMSPSPHRAALCVFHSLLQELLFLLNLPEVSRKRLPRSSCAPQFGCFLPLLLFFTLKLCLQHVCVLYQLLVTLKKVS